MNKEKVKKFAKEHVKEIAGVTISAIAVGVISSAMYRAGFIDGSVSGFHVTMDWFEKHFPEKDLKLNELWDTYKLNNPDQVAYRTGLGKWEKK